MAIKKLDDWAEDFGNALAKLEDWEFLSDEAMHVLMFAMQSQLRAWRAEAMRGAPDRKKAAAHKARQRARTIPGDAPLEFEA